MGKRKRKLFLKLSRKKKLLERKKSGKGGSRIKKDSSIRKLPGGPAYSGEMRPTAWRFLGRTKTEEESSLEGKGGLWRIHIREGSAHPGKTFRKACLPCKGRED